MDIWIFSYNSDTITMNFNDCTANIFTFINIVILEYSICQATHMTAAKLQL